MGRRWNRVTKEKFVTLIIIIIIIIIIRTTVSLLKWHIRTIREETGNEEEAIKIYILCYKWTASPLPGIIEQVMSRKKKQNKKTLPFHLYYLFLEKENNIQVITRRKSGFLEYFCFLQHVNYVTYPGRSSFALMALTMNENLIVSNTISNKNDIFIYY